jgi:hypothetical protein
MANHTDIIKRLGGIRKVAGWLGHTNHTTVQGWSDRNSIPMEHWSSLIQAAEGAGLSLTVGELMPAELRDAAA